ncbi:unnamed protein product [Brassica rapa]|uniref:PGG domain-containing protein n=1 Tax=Brassica campestris TaxID=3711 RepID=A0A8D9DNG8_BRACM|nr:unnamed protein product [Brassica rapa]
MCKSAKEIRDPVNDKSWRDMIYEALLEAVENGNKEFFIEIIKYNPQLLWIFEAVSGRNLFQLAVVFRKEKIFNLIHGLDNRKVALLRSLDKDNNNILHIVAYLSPRPDHLSKISGSALKMQREIRWYMEVKSLVSEREVVQKNNEKMTPRQVFEVSHEPLRKEGEEWMKYTATACSFVAALIATVTFQAIFTVPGGYDETLGKPLLLRDLHFTAFIISDSLAFFTSCTSVLIFLSILTARYSFDDFIVSLPRKMIFGLAILFFSIASLLVGFITALSSTMRQKPTLVVPMKPLAALPVLLFLMLQYPLLKEMISSTYGKRLFHRDTKSWLELPGQDQHANVTSVYVGSSHGQHSVNNHRSQTTILQQEDHYSSTEQLLNKEGLHYTFHKQDHYSIFSPFRNQTKQTREVFYRNMFITFMLLLCFACTYRQRHKRIYIYPITISVLVSYTSICLEFVKENLVMAMGSNYLDSAGLKETFRRSPFKFANTKVPQDEAPNDHLNIQTPFIESALSASRLHGKNTNVYYDYIQLSQGISQGRVEAVKDFLNQRPDAVDEWINFYETPLLKACACGKPEIVKELLRRMTPEQMLPKMSQNASYHTPLTVVAVSGNMEIAEVLIAKNPKLLEIPGNNGQIPVVVAVENTQMEMARYLYTRTPVQVLLDEDGYHGSLLFLNAIFYKMLDIALDLFSMCRRLAVTKHLQIESIPIIVLASKPDLFPGGCYLGPLERFIYSWLEVKLPTLPEASRSSKDQHNTPMGKLHKLFTKWTGIDEVYRMKVMHLQAKKLLLGISEETLAMGLNERSETVDEALLFAVRFGNVDFLVEMIKNNSELLWSTRTSSSSTLFLLAVEFRQEKVFSLLYGLDDRKHLLLADKDCYGNGVLHLAGYPSPPSKLSNVVGATLQMQRELQWFKEVERIAPEIEKERVNTEEQTPSEIFTKEHESLRKEAEKWMKDTAMSCSLVAALIVTVTFAAVFTVPGGTDDNKKGIPFHLKDRQFVTFVVSDLVSCFASCTSVLIFLGILTARYSFDDFLVSLPTKMIAGLSILFVSIAAMLIAFSSALFTMFDDEKWIVPPTILLACFPALLFVLLQYPLLKEMIFSTYGKGIFDRNMKCWS